MHITGFRQPPGWKIHRFFHWKMPFAGFRSGSGVSDKCPNKLRGIQGHMGDTLIFQGEANMHQIVVAIEFRLHPLFPEGTWPFSSTGNPLHPDCGKSCYFYRISCMNWKATKEYLNHRGTKIRVFRVCCRAPLLPPFSPHFPPHFPLQALFTLPPLLPSSPPPLSPLF